MKLKCVCGSKRVRSNKSNKSTELSKKSMLSAKTRNKKWYNSYYCKLLLHCLCCGYGSVKQGNRLTNRYNILGQIGTGKFGVVHLARVRDNNQEVAIKYIFKKNVKNLNNITREIAVLQLLKTKGHPKIYRFYESIEFKHVFCLVLEKCRGKELYYSLMDKKRYLEGESLIIIKDICLGVEHLHKLHIIHRDIKPENIMFDEDTFTLKLIDFGLSIIDRGNQIRAHTKVGTAYYMAPEVLNRYYSNLCDEWSIGVIWYILVTGYPPFNGNNDAEILKNIRFSEVNYQTSEMGSITVSTKQLIKGLLTKKIANRKTATQILQQLG